MKKIDLIKGFINGAEKGRASNLIIKGNVLYNYQTPIAFNKNGHIILNSDYYSVTTKTNQNMIRRETPEGYLGEVSEQELWKIILDEKVRI